MIFPFVLFSLLQEFLQPLNLCLTVFNLLSMGTTDRKTDVNIDRQTGRQSDRQADRQADKQVDRQVDSSTLKYMCTCMDLPLCS